MLHEFLNSYRAEILTLCEEKTVALAGSLESSEKLRAGLPLFFEHLISYLKGRSYEADKDQIRRNSADHGAELKKLNYSLSHVVHAYGSMCQAVTELAKRRGILITSDEFNDLNMCLDVAIASAVSEYEFRSTKSAEAREVQRLGMLVHELRNSLSSATIAHDLIRSGLVGTGGTTARVLEDNLVRMRLLIDRSLSEVRMRAEPQIFAESFSLNDLLDQILITARQEAKAKNQDLSNELRDPIVMHTDRQLLLSCMANLIQNALKYTKENGKIWIRCVLIGKSVAIEIENECGVLDPSSIKSLFKPFVSGGFDQSGLGLGLTIVQRAVSILQGSIEATNDPHDRCIFRIEIPITLVPSGAAPAVTGVDAVQPHKSGKPD